MTSPPRIVIFIIAAVIFLGFGGSCANAIRIPPSYTSQQIADFKEKAAHGDIDAQKTLAYAYLNGYHPLHQDDKESFKYFKQAADVGDAEAQTYVGWLYDNGKGVDKDYSTALKWYHLAEAQGYPTAQDLIGKMYRDGLGVPQSYAIAAEYFKKATLQFDYGPNIHLARLYFTGGSEFPQDYEQAFFWLDITGNPAWKKFWSDQILSWEFEDESFSNLSLSSIQKYLTPEQIQKVRKLTKDYKMPPPTKWSLPNPCQQGCDLP